MQNYTYTYDDFGNFASRKRFGSPMLQENFTYDNVTSSFDRGYTLHEHYDDFGLINMNGMVYDKSQSTVFSYWTIRIDE